MNSSRNKLDSEWQCIVIGAGPAGSMAAIQLARSGAKVLLVEKAQFPRPKICGSCINISAQNALVEAGLPDILKDNGAVPLDGLYLFDGTRKSSIQLPNSWSLSREKLDSLLVNEAIKYGAVFLPNSFAQVLQSETDPPQKADGVREKFVRVKIESSGIDSNLSTSLVVVADGLSGRSLDQLVEFKPTIDQSSRFGAGVILSDGPDYYSRGHIYMACADGGYVGLVRLEDGRLDIAAAFDNSFSRQFHGPAQAALQILDRCGLPIPETLPEAPWSGTQLLTRRRNLLASHRILVAGDATGYPEPFSGEGIAWALWSGLWAGRLAIEGLVDWSEEKSERWHRRHRILRKQQARSTMIAKLLRNALFRSTMMTTFDLCPRLTSHMVRRISAPNLAARQPDFGDGDRK